MKLIVGRIHAKQLMPESGEKQSTCASSEAERSWSFFTRLRLRHGHVRFEGAELSNHTTATLFRCKFQRDRQVADGNEKTATMKNQGRMPIAATLFKVLCTYPLVLEDCAACARGLCCSRPRFALLVPEVCAAC